LLDGSEVPVGKIRKSLGFTAYVSFPAVPALLMIPSAAIAGRAGNDVIPTPDRGADPAARARAPAPRRRRALGRTVRDDLWLVATLAFGSVLFFSAVQGKVWYTAHVVGVALALGYAWASIEARHPLVAGAALGPPRHADVDGVYVLLFIYESGAWR
jgi:hypothetical protein